MLYGVRGFFGPSGTLRSNCWKGWRWSVREAPASELPAAFMIAATGGVTPVMGVLLKERNFEWPYG